MSVTKAVFAFEDEAAAALYGNAAPARATDGAAGFDLVATSYSHAEGFSLGVRILIPEGHFGLMTVRSGIARKGWALATGASFIDRDYREVLRADLRRQSAVQIPMKNLIGRRVCQIAILPVWMGEAVLGEVPRDTARQGGFGSTG